MPAPLHRPIGAPLICRFSLVVCSNLHRKRFFALHLKRCFVSRPSIPVNRERVGMETLLENSVNCTHGTRLDSVRGQRSRERNVDRGKMGEDERGRERRKRESSVQCCRISTAAFSVTFGTRGERVRSHRRTRWPDLTYYSASGAVGIIRCIAI